MAAILENGRQRWPGPNLDGVPIQIYSEYISQQVYQFWCFYEKVNNLFATLLHY